jgi:hypothetical protein
MAPVIERRRSRRRRIPFVKSAVLEANGRSHIVALLDLGPEGAFVATRMACEPGQRLALRLVLPRHGGQERLPCRVVWRSDGLDGADPRPAGLAVRFMGLPAAVIRQVEEFSMEGFLPSPHPRPVEHYEYRLLERPQVDVDELNRLGRDGWRLASAVPRAESVQLVLSRRL